MGEVMALHQLKTAIQGKVLVSQPTLVSSLVSAKWMAAMACWYATQYTYQGLTHTFSRWLLHCGWWLLENNCPLCYGNSAQQTLFAHNTASRPHTYIKTQRLCQRLPSCLFHAAPVTLLHNPRTSGVDELPALGPRVPIHKPVGNMSGSLINRNPLPN